MNFNRYLVSSVAASLLCGSSRVRDPDRTNAQDLKITAGRMCCLCNYICKLLVVQTLTGLGEFCLKFSQPSSCLDEVLLKCFIFTLFLLNTSLSLLFSVFFFFQIFILSEPYYFISESVLELSTGRHFCPALVLGSLRKFLLEILSELYI